MPMVYYNVLLNFVNTFFVLFSISFLFSKYDQIIRKEICTIKTYLMFNSNIIREDRE